MIHVLSVNQDGSCKLTDEGIRVHGFKDNRLSVTDWSNAVLWLLLSFIGGFFKLLGIQTALVQSTQKPCSKGFAEVSMQFRCSTAYFPILGSRSRICNQVNLSSYACKEAW